MTPVSFHLVSLCPAVSASTEAPKHRLPIAKSVICLLIILLCPLSAVAQQSAKKSKFEVETNWPGIQFKLDRVERILDERLLIVVQIVATAKAPPTGTLIGIKPTVAADGTREGRQSATYELRPFSLASSVMIDDLTAQRFPALPAIFPPGREYAPSEILAHFPPGRAEVLTLQFKIPPAALRANSASEKYTVSLLLTNAKGPISGIPIPPPDAQELSVQQ
jgi:hypothetical protein